MIADICATLRGLLEPAGPSQATVDATAAEPFKWRDRTLYVYPSRNAEVGIETGPVTRQDFTVTAVYVLEGHEEAGQERDASVTAALDAKREAYFAVARANQQSASWAHIQAAEQPRPPRTLQGRAVAIEFSGWRIREAS